MDIRYHLPLAPNIRPFSRLINSLYEINDLQAEEGLSFFMYTDFMDLSVVSCRLDHQSYDHDHM